eukprot:403345903
MGQIVNESELTQVKGKTFQINCNQCQQSKGYTSLEQIEEDLEFNYEILALVYKHRPLLAKKASQIYDLPHLDKQSIEVIQVNKIAIDEEKIYQEQKALQMINYIFLQQQNQQKVLAQMREEVICFKCYHHFDDIEHQPIVLDGCTHKLCKSCHTKFYKTNKDDKIIFCIFCGKDREYKEVSETMQKWIIMQGKKKKIVMKREIEALERAQQPAVLQIEKELYSAYRHQEEEKKHDASSPKLKLGFKLAGSGTLRQKEFEDDQKSNSSQMLFNQTRGRKSIKHLVQRHKSILPSEQREIQCSTCNQVFCKLNRPILLIKCPCQQAHQICEDCFKSTTIKQSQKDKTKFKLICPTTRSKEQLNSYNMATKQQLFDYYMNPRSRSVFKINQNLLNFIYEKKNKLIAFIAEKDFAKKHGIKLEYENQQNDSEEEKSEDDSQFEFSRDNKDENDSQIKEENKAVEPRDIKVYMHSEMDEQERLKNMSTLRVGNIQGMRTPGMLSCNHNICIECMKQHFYDVSAFDDEAAKKEMIVKCMFDSKITKFIRYDDDNIGNNAINNNDFYQFWRMNVCINAALLSVLAKAKQDKDNLDKHHLPPIQIKPEYKMTQNWDEAVDEDDGNLSENFQETLKNEQNQVMYDIECPICLLCYTHENPPINLYCREHPDYPFILCKNEMMYYAMKAGSDKDMMVSCPICHNEIVFATKGKNEQQIMNMFEVNQVLLDSIYTDQRFKDYLDQEEIQLKKDKNL